jgi:hypothetical protein
MSTHVYDPTDPNNWNLFLDFPVSKFVRLTWRSNTNTGGNYGVSQNTSDTFFDFWSWTAAWYAENIGSFCSNHSQGCAPLEIDYLEDWGFFFLIGSLHSYTGAGAGGILGANQPPYANQPSGIYDDPPYNTLDVLTTSDGFSDLRTCAWMTAPETGPIHFLGCSPWPGTIPPVGTFADGGGDYGTRNVLVWWIGTGCCGFNPPELPVYALVKTMQVWDCVDWPRGTTGPNPHCFGEAGLTTGADGSQYHKITTQ